MKVLAIIQARMGSTRLPGKVMKPILGQPMLWRIVQRLRWVPAISEVVVATSDTMSDQPIRGFCKEHSILVFSGSEKDVLDRFYQATVQYNGDPLLRITGDCPFVDPEIIGQLIELYKTGNHDHIGVATGAGAIFLDSGRFPDGLDAECFSFSALESAWREATDAADREHVTPYIWRNTKRFRIGSLRAKDDYSRLRWTVDNEADFELVKQIYEALYKDDEPFLMMDILHYLSRHPELSRVNESFIGQEGYEKLWKLPNKVNKA